MSPLERAARALCELANNPPGATMDGKPLWMDYLPEVRAVVEAIGEPSERMAATGVAMAAARGASVGLDDAKAIFGAMMRRLVEVA